MIRRFGPDIVHAHYASSYGLLGALASPRRYCISAWGSDVYVFPKSGAVYKALLKYAFSKAQVICSTSKGMARECKLYYQGKVSVVPFGIDPEIFKPFPDRKSKSDVLKFCTAKSLRPVYNIPRVVAAFVQLTKRNLNKNLELHIAGDGPLREACVKAAGDLLDKQVFLHGQKSHREMSAFLADKHVLVNVPDSESFGVSVLEASAAGLAVLASNAGGLPEVVINEKTGLLLDDVSLEGIGRAMQWFVDHPETTESMGRAGRQFATTEYAWGQCVEKQLEVYDELLKQP